MPESSHTKTVSKPVLYAVIWVFSTGAFAVFGIIFLNMTKFYRLARHEMIVEGRVRAKEPLNHQTVHYSYPVGTQTYYGAGNAGDANPTFDELSIGDPVRVSVNPNNPAESYLGDPQSELNSLIRGLVLIALFPTIVMVVYSIKQRNRK